MQFSWDFLQNMLENGHSNLQTNLWVHITSNIFKISSSKITGSHQPPPQLPTLKAYPTPGVGGRFGNCSLKWRERMNLKVPGAFLPLGCAILSTRAKTVRGVGTRVNSPFWKISAYYDAKTYTTCWNTIFLFSFFFACFWWRRNYVTPRPILLILVCMDRGDPYLPIDTKICFIGGSVRKV